jgi:hypothetical protein
MAESNEKKATTQEKKVRIQAKGPSDDTSNSEVLRYQPMNKRKKKIDIRAGQILTVGEDIEKDDSDRLLNLKVWNFERVND